MSAPDGLTKRVLADTFTTQVEAEAALLTALDALPSHADILRVSVWQFNDSVPSKGGKWTWSLRVGVTIGGYDKREQTPYQRRLEVLMALREEEAVRARSQGDREDDEEPDASLLATDAQPRPSGAGSSSSPSVAPADTGSEAKGQPSSEGSSRG